MHSYRWIDYMRAGMDLKTSFCINFCKANPQNMFQKVTEIDSVVPAIWDYSKLIESCYDILKQYRSDSEVIYSWDYLGGNLWVWRGV